MSNKLFYPICLALVLALAGFAQAELLVNPGFEAGTESWSKWGSGSGSGSGGYLWSSSFGYYNAVEDGTALSGNAYLEAGFELPPQHTESWSTGYCLVHQEVAVTEGKTYEISGWFRSGDGGEIADGGGFLWEWRLTAPEGPTGPRGDLVDVDGDGEFNDDKVETAKFNVTDQWTFHSDVQVAPPGANGLTAILIANANNKNIDLDDASLVEVVPPVVSPYVTSTDQGGLIPIINRDFSEPNDGKHTAFDIESSRKQDEPFLGYMTTDVPGWTTDVSVKDSGIEDIGDPNYGYSAFLLGGYDEWADPNDWIEPPVWQILGYKIQEGDQFRLAVDAKHIWTNGVPVALKMGLFYVDIDGSRQELASLIVDMTEAWEWGTYILDVPELPEMAVGKILGIELQNIAERSSWIHVDNVSLIGD